MFALKIHFLKILKLEKTIILFTFNSDEKILWKKINASLNKSHFNSLTINEFAEKTSINIKTVESIFHKLVSLKQLCKISEKRYFLPKTILKCANIVEKIASENNRGLVLSLIHI